jgi:PAP2 superfamily
MRLLVASRTQGSQATSVAPARINSHMSILLGRDQDGRRLRRSDPTRQSGRPMSETSDAAVTIDLNNLVGLDTREGMNALTDLGDAAVLLPLSIVILLWMLIHHGRRISASWVIAVSLCVGATALLKIYLYACPPQPNLVSPSGHTSLSVLIYGAIALVIAAEQRGWSRAAIYFCGTGLIVAIAGSRLWLNAHTAPEVAIGIIIGIATLTLFADRYGRSRTEGVSLSPFILSVVMVTAVLHGQELRAEAFLHAISNHLHLKSIACTR